MSLKNLIKKQLKCFKYFLEKILPDEKDHIQDAERNLPPRPRALAPQLAPRGLPPPAVLPSPRY